MSDQLPPGCLESDIPGNRPEDREFEEFADWALDQFVESDLSCLEMRQAVLSGIASVKATKPMIAQIVNDLLVEATMCAQMERNCETE